MASFRAILAIAACYDWDIESFAFNGAYLNGTLNDDEEIYMQEDTRLGGSAQSNNFTSPYTG
jgi:hypothetical protein